MFFKQMDGTDRLKSTEVHSENELEECKQELQRQQTESRIRIRQLEKEITKLKVQLQTKSQPHKPSPALEIEICTVRQQLELFFKRRSSGRVQEVFDRYRRGRNLLLKQDLSAALNDLGVAVSPGQPIDDLFKRMDLNKNGGLDLDEFQRAVHLPGALEQCLSNLPLAPLLASCFPPHVGPPSRNAAPAGMTAPRGAQDSDILRGACDLDAQQQEVVLMGFREGLDRVLSEYLAELQTGFEALNQQSQQLSGPQGAMTKFKTFKMACGSVDDFHNGMRERTGFPHPDIMKGIEAEHFVMFGCDETFVTSNYSVSTCPRAEYEIVMGLRPCRDKDRRDRSGRLVRVIRTVEELMLQDLAGLAGLTRAEVVLLSLYTGPMFERYNLILRQFPEEDYRRFAHGGNLFPTTIHVLVSAIAKIAQCAQRDSELGHVRTQVSSLPEGLKLFRGLGGLMDLPECFFRPDDHGCRGYMEFGFLSTTADPEIALEYSGVREGKPFAMVLEMTIDSVNRGACILDFSQYPSEPAGACTIRAMAGGVVTIVPVRICANLKTLKVEQLISQKKDLHCTTFTYALDELARDLDRIAADGHAEARLQADPTRVYQGVTYTIQGFRDAILSRCRKVLDRHRGIPPARYTVDEAYRGLVTEMLNTKTWALSSLAHYLEDPSYRIWLHKKSLLDAHQVSSIRKLSLPMLNDMRESSECSADNIVILRELRERKPELE